jgi:hypothetical protein
MWPGYLALGAIPPICAVIDDFEGIPELAGDEVEQFEVEKVMVPVLFLAMHAIKSLHDFLVFLAGYIEFDAELLEFFGHDCLLEFEFKNHL